MKWFKKLVQSNIMSLISFTFDAHTFSYRANKYTKDCSTCIFTVTALSYLKKQISMDAWLLFINFSSVSNNTTLCHYYLNCMLLDKTLFDGSYSEGYI